MLYKIDSHAVTDCLQHSHAGLFESLTPMSPVYMGSFKLLTDQCHTQLLANSPFTLFLASLFVSLATMSPAFVWPGSLHAVS